MYAVIDVGSNSVRLMFSDGVNTLSKEIKTTQLAEGLSKTNMLKPEAVERTARAVSFFIEKAKSSGVQNPYVFATAGVRQAKNGDEFVKRVKELSGEDVDVVSGELEANLGVLGALNGKSGGVIDIGGASTEIIVSNGKDNLYCKSINVGAVRLKDLCGQDIDSTIVAVKEKISEFGVIPKTNYYAIGGTATTIAAMIQELEVYDPNKVDGFIINKFDVFNLRNKLFSMTIDERKTLKGLQSERAEIIAHGTALLYEIMCRFDLEKIIVSEKDNLEGYLISKRGYNE